MIKAIKGTKDILPENIGKWNFLESVVKKISLEFHYGEIRTPIFEETGLFSRGIGESSDIVSKEMYTFVDRSGTSITLKPEMTASVVRAYIEHSFDKQQSFKKYFYISPMFRQERPQAGRLRQFHQFGVEALGSNNFTLDAEVILMAYLILKEMGLNNLSVKINSLGVPESRENYKKILRSFLSDKFDGLSDDSKRRYDTNILRIFDSKDERDIQIMENAPHLIEYLDDDSLEHFENVKQILLKAGVPIEVDPILVRGLDYYTNTTFEITSGSVGTQTALCGGGRYNLLVKQLGGKDIPGVGFAAGMERILLACENENVLNLPGSTIDLYVVSINKNFGKEIFEIVCLLRGKGLSVEMDYQNRSVKAQMREANRLKASKVLMIGGDEYERGTAILKSMEDGEQKEISLSKLDKIIREG